MKKNLLLILIAILGFSGVVYGAPTTSYQPTLLPITDSTYDLGSALKVWNNLYVNQICLSTDCKSAWPTGGGGGGAGTFSTTTIAGRTLQYPYLSTLITSLGSSATTTSVFWFDPQTQQSFIKYASSTAITISGTSYLGTIGSGVGTGLTGTAASLTAGLATALAGNGTNCSAGSYALGIDASGNSEGCTVDNAGTVTAVSVASANGFTGSSSGGATPALTLTTSISGVLKGNGTAISAGANGTDYTLISANTCSAGQHVSAVSATGTVTCSADSGGTGLSAYDAWTHPFAGQSATTSLMLFSGNASTTGLSAGYGYFGTTATTSISKTGVVTLAGLGTPAGSILAVNANGDIIATTTSSGGVSAVSGTYPVLSSGGTSPVISLAFGTTTSNLWAGTQTFTNAPILSSLTGVLLGNGSSALTAGSTQTCTNQFFRSLSSAFVVGCATVSLTADVTGTLPIANGGTGSTVFSPNSIITSNAAGTALVATTSNLYVTSLIGTSTTATNWFGQSLFNGATPVAGLGTSNAQVVVSQSVDNIGNQVYMANTSMGANAAACATFANGNSTNAGASAVYIGGLCFGGPNFATAGFSGLKPNGLALYATNGGVDIGAISSNPASSTVNFYGGNNGGFAGSMPDMTLRVSGGTLAGGNAYLGIGTTSPKAAFHVNASTTAQVLITNKDTETGVALRAAGSHLYIASTSPTTFATTTGPVAVDINLNAGTNLGFNYGSTTPFAVLGSVRQSGSAPLLAVASSTVSGSNMPNFMLDQYGRPFYSGPKPVCDANCTFVAGNDARFRVKLGSAVTTSTVTFANGSWGLAPICIANEGDAGTVAVTASSTPTTVVLTALSSLTTKDVDIMCDGIQ